MTTETMTRNYEVSEGEIEAIERMVERLQRRADAAEAAFQVTAPAAVPVASIRPRSLSSLTYEEAIGRLDAAHPLISELLEATGPRLVVIPATATTPARTVTETPFPRLHPTIVAVDEVVGEAIAQGAAAHEARKPDPCVIGALRGHIDYSAITRLRCTAAYPEAAPYRGQIEALIAALTL